MDRYTRKDAEKAFELLCAALGRRAATSWDDVGGWQLDYSSAYGGFVVHEVMNTSGGVGCPMGHSRRTARDFVDACRFARYAVDEAIRERV